jgi:RNA polymerase sigma-70 factor (ECF subfamily)
MAERRDIPSNGMTEPRLSEASAAVLPVPAPGTAPPRLAGALARHFALVWRTLRRFGVPEADVDDNAQLAFLTLSSRLADVAPGAERSFLLGTCQRLAANQRRKLARRPEELGDDPDQRLGELPNPEEAMQSKQRRELLDQGLELLPLEQRSVFVLYELEGFSLPEIADSLSIPLGTATSRLRRAREKFEAWASSRPPEGVAP